MATYYVKNAGNDAADGLSDANAWATISKVWTYGVGTGFNPGDTICFNRGDKWEEQLVFPNAGVLGSQITITAYGTGARPIITGRDDITGWDNPANWTQVGATDVWYMTLSHSSTRPRIWLNEIEVESASSALLVTNLLPYYHDQATTRLYVYSPAPATPATHYTRIEKPNVRTTAIDINKKGYLTISNLDIQGGRYGIRITESSGMIVEDCNIGKDTERIGIYVVYSGAAPYDHSENGILRNCTVDSGFRFYQDWVYGDPYFCLDGVNIRAAKNWKVYSNYVQDWNHCGMVLESYFANYTLDYIDVYSNIITCPSTNYGHGLDVDIDSGMGIGNKFHHNLIFNIGTQNQINGYGLEFYYNIINTVRGAAGYAGQGSGLDFAGYEGNPSNQKIYNNVIANCEDYGIRIYDWVPSGYHDKTGIEFINNILYNNDSDDGYQIYIYTHANINTNTFKNNLFYKYGVTDLIRYSAQVGGSYNHTIAEFNAENGTNGDTISDNIEGDPLFVSSSDFSLQEGSPAIGAGINVGLTEDFIGTLVGLVPDIGAYQWFAILANYDKITLVNTPACYNAVDNTIVSRWVATECPINFTLLRRDWYITNSSDVGGFLAISVYGTFSGNDGDVISVYDLTTNSMYTGTITDKSGDPILITDIPYVAGMDIKYLNDHTLYAGYYFEGRLTINGVVESLTVIASPDSFGYADLDVSGILRIKTSIGKVTNYLSLIQKDTNKSGQFTLEYRGCWYGSNEAWISEGSQTSPASEVVWYYAECVRSEEQGCNLAEYVPTDLNDAPFLNQFDTPVYWYGLPFDLSFILPERAELSPASDIIVTMKVYNSANVQIGTDIVQTIDVDSLEGYVNSLNINSTLIDAGAAYFTVEIFSM